MQSKSHLGILKTPFKITFVRQWRTKIVRIFCVLRNKQGFPPLTGSTTVNYLTEESSLCKTSITLSKGLSGKRVASFRV